MMGKSRKGSNMSLTEEGILETKRENMGNDKFHLHNIVDNSMASKQKFNSRILLD